MRTTGSYLPRAATTRAIRRSDLLVASLGAPSNLSTDDGNLVERLIDKCLLPAVLQLRGDGRARERLGFLNGQI